MEEGEVREVREVREEKKDKEEIISRSLEDPEENTECEQVALVESSEKLKLKEGEDVSSKEEITQGTENVEKEKEWSDVSPGKSSRSSNSSQKELESIFTKSRFDVLTPKEGKEVTVYEKEEQEEDDQHDKLQDKEVIHRRITTIITDYPLLLVADADESLAPKLKLLQNRGASTSELTEVLSKVPKILRIKKDKALGRYYDFVREIIEADKSSKFERLCLSLPLGSRQENKIRNVLVLRDLGVPQRLLFPLLISRSAHVCGKEGFEESLKKVLEMGFDPTTPKFVKALHTVYELSDKTIEEKVNVYKRLGFGVGDVWKIFKKHPSFLKFSEKNISNSIDTFLGLGFSRVELAGMVKRFPQCIGLSAETVKKKNEFLVEKMKCIWM
ncbi:hypothetical protein YC2023_106475 [Brassica napus]